MNCYKIIFLLSLLFILQTNVYSQVGIGNTNPDASAILDITSTTRGMLTPRMTTVQRVAIASPAEGLVVFDIDEYAFYYYDGVDWVRLISENSISDYTGWADYVDGTYTSASPLSLTGSNKITLPNDANTIRDSQKPTDVTEFYNSTNSTITGRNGDGINIVIEFKAKPTTGSITKLTIAIDIGGAVGEIYIRDFIMSKGNGVEHYYLSSFNAYTLDTWETNGGTVKIVSDAAAEVYDIRYVIARTHKAR
ncbi:hypothetical protein [Flavivirga sp. 57AJ16]|uniref:hypothetical protein n=1 Tax=Flavivirga sp. 57AJ16 TaxID=3025307 RepID=UPI002365D020|nr:hypothetical protein [Flavivirga sp. 57AJ16]MDD7886998.1 hypothetical protein [Flavivirga sp. 57AJ16]